MNPILDELHAVREKLLADAGGTLDALVDRLQAEEKQSSRLHYIPRRTIRRTPTVTSVELPEKNHSSPPADL